MELVIDARRMLFDGLIDYAGLFPPASLGLDEAVAEYRESRRGACSWMLGRFLCPTTAIEDLAGQLTQTMAAGEAPWSVGAIFDEPVASASLHAAVFDRHMDPAARVTAVEVRTPVEASDGRSSEAAADVIRPVATAATTVAPEAHVFLELAVGPAWETGLVNAVGAIAALRRELLHSLGAKLRTGGLEAAAFPAPETVGRFILACHGAGVPFKATAGLHHPFRDRDDELGVTRHGFVNLLVAASLAADGAPEADVVAAIADDDREAFGAGPAGLRWRDRRIGAQTIRRMRRNTFPAYGSCSFDEPVGDLVALGMVER